MSDTAANCFEFFNSQLYFRDRDLQMLLRALQQNPPKQRLRCVVLVLCVCLICCCSFFEEVRGCRRRLRTPWEKVVFWPCVVCFWAGSDTQPECNQAPVAKLFTMPDEYQLLELRATIARIRSLLQRKVFLPVFFFPICSLTFGVQRLRMADAFRAFDYDRDG